MFVLIDKTNKYDLNDNIFIARVISVHQTFEAAERSDDKVQKNVKRYNGQSCYVPTIIAKTNQRLKVGDKVEVSAVREFYDCGVEFFAEKR